MRRSFPPERALPGFYRGVYYLLILAAGFLVGHLLWERIHVPFSNGPGVTVGPLVEARYAPLNNTIKFVVFAGMPALLYLLLSFLLRGRMPALRPLSFAWPRFDRLARSLSAALAWMERRRRLVLFLHLLILFLLAFSGILRFFSFPFEVRPFDVFHEGESLTPAYVFARTGQLWKGTFFIHGALYDPLITVMSWKFFGVESVGAARLGFLFSHALLPLGFAGYVFTLGLALGRKLGNVRGILLVQLLVLAFTFTDAAGEGFLKIQMWERRDLPVLLALSALNLALFYKNYIWKSRVWLVVTGLGSAANYIYTLDRGAYFTTYLFVLLALLIVFPLRRTRRAGLFDAGVLLLGVLLGWLVFIGSAGLDELRYFLIDAREIYSTAALFSAFVYPASALYRLPMVLIGLQLMMLLVFFFARYVGRHPSNPILYVHLSIVCLAVFHFRTALGRSDIAHLFYSSTFAVIGAAFFAWLVLRGTSRRTLFALVLLLLVFNVRRIAVLYKKVKPAKVAAYVANVRSYVSLDDSVFVEPKLRPALEDLRREFAGEERVFNYTSDAVLPYVMKKLPAGRDFIVWFSSSKARRAVLEQELRQANPRLIIYDGLYVCYDGFCNDRRFPELHRYIAERYVPYRKFGPWSVLRRRD